MRRIPFGRGQLVSMDLILAVIVFVGLIVGFFYFVGIFSEQDDLGRLARSSEFAAQSLEQNLTSYGFIEGNTIVLSKLYEFSEGNYTELQAALGINSDFCIYFEDENGNIIPINGQAGIGSDRVAIGAGGEYRCGVNSVSGGSSPPTPPPPTPPPPTPPPPTPPPPAPPSCSGTIALSLNPSSTTAGTSVQAIASGLSNCGSRSVFFSTSSSCASSFAACSSESGCSVSFTAPSSTTTYYSCIDIDSSGGYDANEVASAVLTITPPCASGYRDYDKDTFGAGAYGCYVSSTSYNVVPNNQDCYDNSGSARPGQTIFFNSPRGSVPDNAGQTGSSYDYNCDFTETREYGNCVATLPAPAGCFGSSPPSGIQGYLSSLPSCGQANAGFRQCWAYPTSVCNGWSYTGTSSSCGGCPAGYGAYAVADFTSTVRCN